MAYIVKDEDMSSVSVVDDNDDDHTFEDGNGDTVKKATGGGGSAVTRTAAGAASFLSATDRPAHAFAVPQQPPGTVVNARRNILDVIEGSTIMSDGDEASAAAAIEFLPPPSAKETVRVYLRVKPKTDEEEVWRVEGGKKRSLEEEEDLVNMVRIENDYQVAVTAPSESHTYKNSMNGAGKLVHRYAFTKIFPPQTAQSDLFDSMVLPRVKEFLEGQNQLVFTYGASSSGKTHTIQGEPDNPGILPRALDVLFNSVADRQGRHKPNMLGLELKPNCFNRVVLMKDKDIRKLEDDKHNVFHLGMELQAQKMSTSSQHQNTHTSQLSSDASTLESADVTNMSQQSLATMFPKLSNRVRDETVIAIKHDEINYAIWISFAEIYNESIYDLLEKIPAPKRKGDKPPKRNALKLAEDKNGSIYVRGLKEVKVNSADEAYQVMMIGRENLHFAATRLNHHSSRSHCIFTIKAIRVAETAKPHLARVSMLSFCDLAGSERVKKAGNTGERQKEAGNINTSLLVLGRCIKAIRHNQLLKEVRKHQVVPFRESKLTRMFQSFLVGHGKASMVVNISQAPYLFDESLQVLKFAAVASKVTVVQKVETPETVKHPKKRKITRFSIMVGENKKNNPLMGRGSIAWDKPAARSTLCPTLHQSTFHHDDVDATFEDTTVVEENDERYDGLLKLIDNLKDQLIKEKQEKLTMEAEVRTELCEEFNQMMVEIESGWERRLQDQKERSKELSDWQISKLEEAYKNKKRKRAEVSSTAAAAEPGPMGNETALFQRDELEVQLEEKETELKCLKEKVSAMMDAHKCMSEEGKKRQEELAKKTHEGAKMGDRVEAMEAELKEARAEAESANAAKMASVESNSPDPIIEDLGRQLRESEDKRSELTVKNANMKELLDEAGEDFYEKVEESAKLAQTLKESDKQMMQQTLVLNELQLQIEESRLLLTGSASREEEMERMISEMEEKLEAAPSREEYEQIKTRRDELEANLVEVKLQNVGYASEKSEMLLQLQESKVNAAAEVGAKEEGEAKKSEEELREKEEEVEGLKKEIEVLKKCAEMKKETVGELERNIKKTECDRARIERELNDEMEGLKQAKKKLKQTVDEKTKEMNARETEITNLEREVKSLLQAEKQQSDVNGEIKSEVGMLRKQIKDITSSSRNSAKAEIAQLKKRVAEMTGEAETARILAESKKKEDDAFSILTRELETKEAERVKLNERVAVLDGDVAAREHELKRTRGEKESLMAHYDQLIKAKTDELAMEKRESKKIREVMARSTPTKETSSSASSNLVAEVQMLRDELSKKTEVIKQLEAMIPQRKSPSKSDEDEASLRRDLASLRKDLEHTSNTHAKELAKMKKASEKLIAEYKGANLELQKRVPPPATPSSADHSTADMEAEEDDSSTHNSSGAAATTSGRGRKRKKVRTTSTTASTKSSKSKRHNAAVSSPTPPTADSASQASFVDDSNIVGVEDDDDETNDDSFVPSGRKPKRESRVTRTSKPSRKVAKLRSTSIREEDGGEEEEDTDGAGTPGGLRPALLKLVNADNLSMAAPPPPAFSTPANAGRKRQLYKESKAPEMFTPPIDLENSPMTPKTIVKRQLRSRSSRKT